jgi:hypothetical protein
MITMNAVADIASNAAHGSVAEASPAGGSDAIGTGDTALSPGAIYGSFIP